MELFANQIFWNVQILYLVINQQIQAMETAKLMTIHVKWLSFIVNIIVMLLCVVNNSEIVKLLTLKTTYLTSASNKQFVLPMEEVPVAVKHAH